MDPMINDSSSFRDMKMGFIPATSRWTESRNDSDNTVDPTAMPNPTGNSDTRRNPIFSRGSKVNEVDAAKCEAEFFADDQPALQWKSKCLSVYQLPIFSG